MTDRLKVCNTTDLRVLNAKANRARLNRTINLDAIDVDPDGNHVLHMVLFGHNMDSTALHHRARVLIKTVGTMDPTEALLDILDEDWNRLTGIDPTNR